jgi:hypothetical protein
VAGMHSASFERFAGACAILTAIASFLYAVAFVIVHNVVLSALFLTAIGLLSLAVLVAVYYRLRQTNAPFALWALVLGIAGALGSAVHGGYDLANAIHPPSSALAELPSPVDPRGLLTFGFQASHYLWSAGSSWSGDSFQGVLATWLTCRLFCLWCCTLDA